MSGAMKDGVKPSYRRTRTVVTQTIPVANFVMNKRMNEMLIYTELKNLFKTLTPLEVAAAQLVTAEHELLKAETGVEYASALVTFNKTQIKRLRAYISAKADEVSE
jgi:hypothetical protein